MSKTLTSIITVGAFAALAFVPGVGQVLQFGLVGAGVGGAAAANIALGLTVALGASTLQTAAGLAGLGPKAPKAAQTESSLKTERPPRISAYGRTPLPAAFEIAR